MKGEKIFIILLISSLILVTPSIKDASTVTVFPDTVKQTVLQIQTPTITLTTDILELVYYNISYIDLTTNTTISLIQQANFLDKVKISVNHPGMYLIELLSSQLGVVHIKQSGIYPILLVFIIPLAIVNFVIVYTKIKKLLLVY